MSNDQSNPLGFNPYHKWLGISKEVTQPNHYQLLGLTIFESDPEVIASAADAQRGFLRNFQNGPQAEIAKKVLDEIAEARLCLLQSEQKAEYDEQLREHLKALAAEAAAAAKAKGTADVALPPGVTMEEYKAIRAEMGESDEDASEGDAESEGSEGAEEGAEDAEGAEGSAEAEDSDEAESTDGAVNLNFMLGGVGAAGPAAGSADSEGGESDEDQATENVAISSKPILHPKKKGRRAVSSKSVKKTTRANVKYTDRKFGEDSGEVVNEKPIKVFRQIIAPIILVLLFCVAMFWLPYTSRHKEATQFYEKAQKAIAKNDLDKAKKYIDEAVKLNPRKQDLDVYVEFQSQVDQMIKERTEAQRAKKWADIHFQKAVDFYDKHQLAKADEEIDKALRAFPYEPQYQERKKQIAKKRGYTYDPPKPPEPGSPEAEAAEAAAKAAMEAEEDPNAPKEPDQVESRLAAIANATEEEKRAGFQNIGTKHGVLSGQAPEPEEEKKAEEKPAEKPVEAAPAPEQTAKAEEPAKEAEAPKAEEPKAEKPAVAKKDDKKHRASSTYTKKTKSGEKLVKNVNGALFKFRFCKYGTFQMGSPESETDDNYKRQPDYIDETQYTVSLTQSFWILETEVTVGMWKSVMGSGPGGAEDQPVTNVSWNDCQAFCQKLSELLNMEVCLPTEAQWEYAGRAGSRRGSQSVNIDPSVWYRGNSGNTSHPVGQKSANTWGLFDVHGNLAEWCQDWAAPYPRTTTTSIIDPEGPKSGAKRICRGGSFRSDEDHCRTGSRAAYPPDYRSPDVGFRVVAY